MEKSCSVLRLVPFLRTVGGGGGGEREGEGVGSRVDRFSNFLRFSSSIPKICNFGHACASKFSVFKNHLKS